MVCSPIFCSAILTMRAQSNLHFVRIFVHSEPLITSVVLNLLCNEGGLCLIEYDGVFLLASCSLCFLLFQFILLSS
jgi:hypothetical protein